MNAKFKAISFFLTVAGLIFGFYLNSQRDALLEWAVLTAQEKASEIIGTQVKVGNAAVDYWSLSKFEDSGIILRDVEIFDRDSELIARLDETKVTFKLRALWDKGAGAVDKVRINGAHFDLKKREDTTWNVIDIQPKSSGESEFSAKIFLTGGSVDATFDGQNVAVENISAQADCADLNAIDTKISAQALGSQIEASGTLGSATQILNATVDTLDIAKILPFVPSEIIPEGVEIQGGIVENARLNLFHHEDILSYSGAADFHDGTVKVVDTEIEKITGSTTFTDAAFRVNASASANGQTARVSGSVRMDTEEPFFDIVATAEGFVPSEIVPALGVNGAVSFDSRLNGTRSKPVVQAAISSRALSYGNIAAANFHALLQYANNAVRLSEIYAESLGGTLQGEVELKAQKLAYNAHAKLEGISIAQVRNFFDVDFPVNGDISADVAFSGIGDDLTTLKIFGQATASNVTYENFAVDGVESSFYVSDDDLKLDYLSVKLPNRGKFNVEGTVTDKTKLDLEFYGAHVDLALVKDFNPLLDVSGLSDFKGSVRGNIENPQVELKLSAVDSEQNGGARFKGVVFNQKYDSLKLAASGSLDGVSIDDFELEKDGTVQWVVIDGVVSLIGDKAINVRLDTVDARIEDIVAIVAPDQELTGNVDNTIRITGTLEKPHIVGYVELKYGSYQGFLVNAMRGDYYLEGETVRLQDFVITTPMVDMVLNGTLDKNTYAMNFLVEGRELELKRLQGKFPYEVKGQGQFRGELTGTLNSPLFEGALSAGAVWLNGVELREVQGRVKTKENRVELEGFSFNQGAGMFELSGSFEGGRLSGEVSVKSVEIGALLRLANEEGGLLEGRLTSAIELGGTVENPAVKVRGEIAAGTIVGHDLHSVEVDMQLVDHVLKVGRFAGKQGASGEFSVKGQASVGGAIDLTALAHNIELGIIGDFFGVEVEGTGSIQAKAGGSVDNPTGEVLVQATGAIMGSKFDLLRANVQLKGRAFEVEELVVRRLIASRLYQASAKGRVTMGGALDVEVSLDDADLSLLPVLSNMVAWAVGEMSGSVKVTGEVSSPQVNGSVSVSDGTIAIKGLKNNVEHVNLKTRFAGERFEVEGFSGKIGAGSFAGSGGLSYANYEVSDYRFGLKAEGLEVKTLFFNGPISGWFELSEARLWRGTLPKLSGEVDLANCLLSVPALPESDTDLPELIMDVSVNLGEGVHFYSARLYNMYLEGAAKFEGLTTYPKPSGLITVKRGGTLNYLQSVFDIQEGEALFNRVGSFLPTVNFNAETRLTNTKIDLSLSGTLGDMKMTLSSTPEMSETEILQVLTLRDAYGNSTSNMSLADVLAIGLQLSILGDIEDTVRKTLGFDKFTFSGGSGSAFENYSDEESVKQNDDFHISLGKYISDKVMLKYTQGLSGERVTRYGFQYDFNDNLGLTLEREANDYILSVEARYKF